MASRWGTYTRVVLPSPRHLLVSIALVSACSSGGVAVAVPWLVVPDSAELAGAVVGIQNELVVEVGNTGTAPAEVALSVSAPFTLAADHVVVAPDEVRVVVVRYAPATYTPISGTLELTAAGTTHEVALSAVVAADADGDGHDAAAAGGSDCDDLDPDVHPGVPEVCDGVDNDCSGAVDDADPLPSWAPDLDSDGFGDAHAVPEQSCDPPSSRHVQDTADCDDADATVHPGATEVWYDGVDQDCDGASDHDRDQDGADNAGTGGTDCIDTDPTIHPGAIELFDGVDQDCDGHIDEDFRARGDLVITELMVDPVAVPAASGQYLELYNRAVLDVGLGDVTFDAGLGPALLPELWLSPGAVVLLCVELDPRLNGGLGCDGAMPTGLAIAGSVVLDDGTGAALDEVDWSGWPVPQGAALELGAAELHPDANDVGSSWCAGATDLGSGDLGTPGSLTPPC